jgi:hypothetical protein
MAIRVGRKRVLSNKTATTAEREAGVTYDSQGTLPADDLIDQVIEDEKVRIKLDRDEGNISVTILPGDRLGDLCVNVQFEGKSGERELCLQEQDMLLQHASEWLADLLDEFGCDFEASFDARPCPHAAARLQIDRAARLLTREHAIEHKIDLRVGGQRVVPGPQRTRHTGKDEA